MEKEREVGEGIERRGRGEGKGRRGGKGEKSKVGEGKKAKVDGQRKQVDRLCQITF